MNWYCSCIWLSHRGCQFMSFLQFDSFFFYLIERKLMTEKNRASRFLRVKSSVLIITSSMYPGLTRPPLTLEFSHFTNRTMQFKCIHIYWSDEQKFEQIQVVIENKTRRKENWITPLNSYELQNGTSSTMPKWSKCKSFRHENKNELGLKYHIETSKSIKQHQQSHLQQQLYRFMECFIIVMLHCVIEGDIGVA